MDLEQQIKAVGADKAPRITPADAEANIDSEHYFTAAHGDWAAQLEDGQDSDLDARPKALSLLTFCVLVLKNGFTVTGESACASPENFNAEVGRRVARDNAVAKVWPLLGFRLKDRLHEAAVKDACVRACEGWLTFGASTTTKETAPCNNF